MKKTFFLLIAVIFSISCALLNACSFNVKSKTLCKAYADADKYSVGSFTLSSEGITTLDINWCVGDVVLLSSEGNEISVTESGADLKENQKLRYFADGETLRIQFWLSGLSGSVKPEDKRLEVRLPSGIVPDIKSVSGNVNLSHLNAPNALVETVSGKIEADGIIASAANFKSVSGSISLGSISVSDLSIETTSGSIGFTLQSCAKITAKTVSGRTKILLDGNGARINFSTVSGKYQAPDGAKTFGDGSCDISVESVSGGLTVN